MSLLPQSKKSAEEIAHLRESLGIPQDPASVTETVDIIIPATHKAVLEHPQEPIRIEPPLENPPHETHTVYSLKRAERIPDVPVPKSPPAEITDLPPNTDIDHPVRRVRSLRKSEQVPLPPAKSVTISADSPLPYQRHNDHELSDIRRRDALTLLAAPPPPKITHAHPALIAPGYLTSVAAAVGVYYYDLQMAITAGCVTLALLIAILICFRHPYSRHHAAFITVSALIVAAFSALHYFPQLNLQHGS